MTKTNFHHLRANLKRPICEKSDFDQNFATRLLPRLNHGNYRSSFLEKLLPNTCLIIEPKIVGFAILLNYEHGLLKNWITQEGFDERPQLGFIQNVPNNVPILSPLQIYGVIYAPSVFLAQSKKLFIEHLDQLSSGNRLSFLGLQILNTDLNYLSQNKELKKLGFSTPPIEFTRFGVSEVEIYICLWKSKKLFLELPSDGIVLKANSRKLQKQLGQSGPFLNWAYAISC